MDELTLTYHGQVTAKKNSKQIVWNRRSGQPMIISNHRARKQANDMVESFAIEASLEGWKCGEDRTNSTFYVEIEIWNKDRRRRDLDNQVTSILDALVLVGVLPDDGVDYVQRLFAEYKGIDREDPRAVIKIREIAWQVD